MSAQYEQFFPTWLRTGVLAAGAAVGLAACSAGDDGDSVTVDGDVSVAYVKRSDSTLGNPTDAIITGQGGDLYMREKSSPSATEINITGSLTNGQGDVSDPEVSYDGKKILFAMRCSQQSSRQCTDPNTTGTADTRWRVWEYEISSKQFRRILCDAAFNGDDVDPAYLPDGRIVFASNRQEGSKRQMQAAGITPYTYLDEYEREPTTALHVMGNDGTNCRQISFNQSHQRNPVVLSSGEIMFSQWDHVGGRNQFTVFKINPDGTNLFVVYGAHSPGNSYLHPREMPDGRIMSTTMPLSGTREGGSIEIMDANHYSDNDEPGTANPPPNQLGQLRGQFQVSRLLFPGSSDATHEAMRGMHGVRVSPLGRYSTPYPLWDGTGRVLTVFTPSQPTQTVNALGQPITVEGTPRYGIYMLNLGNRTLRPIVLPQQGFYFSDPIALQGRPLPQVKPDFVPDLIASGGAGQGLFDVNTVYDTDRLQRMGDGVLAAGENIPRVSGAVDIANIKLPGTSQYANRVARFFRITKAVPTPGGLSRGAIGETEFEMQQIVGYGVIEPDGSIRARVPSDTPITITALDKEGRAFTPHTHWIQAREGERRFCKGCHSSRLSTTNANGGSFLNDPAVVGIHPGGTASTTMAQTRAIADPSNYPNLRRDPVYADYWTTLYNASATPEASINLGYVSGTTPAVKSTGGATCNGTNWSAKDCAIVINFPEHIQPILNAKCVSCHSGGAPAAGLDLSNVVSGEYGRMTSYQELLVGDPIIDANGLPVITINDQGKITIEREDAPVNPGEARASRLIERMFEQRLKSASMASSTRAFCLPDRVTCFNGATWTDHSGRLTVAERRLLVEWADIGAQYYNDVFDSSGNMRSVRSLLSEDVFECRVQPILRANCAGCHQPFDGNGSSSGTPNASFQANRFILTGNAVADFYITASMITDVSTPTSSLLLSRPSRASNGTPPHPDVPGSTTPTAVLPTGSSNYNAILSWITAGASATCP